METLLGVAAVCGAMVLIGVVWIIYIWKRSDLEEDLLGMR